VCRQQGLHQSLDEQIASFGKLKARGLLTEDEYAEAVALIELQRLDLPGDEDLDVDDHQGGEENSRVHNGSSAHGNGSNGKSNSSSGLVRRATENQWQWIGRWPLIKLLKK